jgi:glucuronate isomerase
MPEYARIREMEEALGSFAWMDPHTHIDAAHLSARGLDDILFYHMSLSDLYAAGYPNGARMDEDRSPAEARRRIREALPYLPKVRNTSMSFGVRTILEDLYGWREPITEANYERLDALIGERSGDSWAREIIERNRVARTGTELWRGRGGIADDLFQYSIEWAFFARTQWGQPDIPLFELERTWNDNEPTPPISVTFDRATAPPLAKTIRTVEDVHAAIEHYCALIPYARLLSTAQHLATDIDYSYPTVDEMSDALKRRAQAGNRERDIYASYILHRFLAELEKHGDRIVFQFSFGAEALPFESGSRLNQKTIGQLAEIVARYPRLRFQCFLASRHANQAMCTLVRELPNLSLAGYWWHNFFPGPMRQVMEERLDMLPLNRQLGFFSDAYCVDWAYAKKKIVTKILAELLAAKVAFGQYSRDDAVAIAQAILHDSAVELLGMAPKPAPAAAGI